MILVAMCLAAELSRDHGVRHHDVRAGAGTSVTCFVAALLLFKIMRVAEERI